MDINTKNYFSFREINSLLKFLTLNEYSILYYIHWNAQKLHFIKDLNILKKINDDYSIYKDYIIDEKFYKYFKTLNPSIEYIINLYNSYETIDDYNNILNMIPKNMPNYDELIEYIKINYINNTNEFIHNLKFNYFNYKNIDICLEKILIIIANLKKLNEKYDDANNYISTIFYNILESNIYYIDDLNLYESQYFYYKIKNEKIEKKKELNSIQIQTPNINKEVILNKNMPVIISGTACTGKSTLIKQILEDLNNKNYNIDYIKRSNNCKYKYRDYSIYGSLASQLGSFSDFINYNYHIHDRCFLDAIIWIIINNLFDAKDDEIENIIQTFISSIPITFNNLSKMNIIFILENDIEENIKRMRNRNTGKDYSRSFIKNYCYYQNLVYKTFAETFNIPYFYNTNDNLEYLKKSIITFFESYDKDFINNNKKIQPKIEYDSEKKLNAIKIEKFLLGINNAEKLHIFK